MHGNGVPNMAAWGKVPLRGHIGNAPRSNRPMRAKSPSFTKHKKPRRRTLPLGLVINNHRKPYIIPTPTAISLPTGAHLRTRGSPDICSLYVAPHTVVASLIPRRTSQRFQRVDGCSADLHLLFSASEFFSPQLWGFAKAEKDPFFKLEIIESSLSELKLGPQSTNHNPGASCAFGCGRVT
ncbi:uncharacterized protein PV07_11890 [Cladophialophora immunda]|uniref:Uncharacterized protein n=1 Tax=Cladophialophora immunda TaxID=569365 RepID=A0A0D1Z7T4_9EURO|nr:uncharacterized protein PV07_11890 [Cladophialophora immunda]KIW23711.1 hypothetical protein PV07_11890 [Cladophialophora immunda]